MDVVKGVLSTADILAALEDAAFDDTQPLDMLLADVKSLARKSGVGPCQMRF